MKYIILFLFLPLMTFAQWQELNSPGIDVPGSQLPLGRETSCYFSTGSALYFGLGSFDYSISSHYFSDFFTFDLTTNKWSEKNSIAFDGREYAFSDFINGKGYTMMGSKATGGGTWTYNDCWEYDTSSDAWTQKADFPGLSDFYTCGFANSNMIYILSTRVLYTAATNDLYQFNPDSNIWTMKNSPPFPGRNQAAAFTIGNNSYVTGGADSLFQQLTDLWMYDPINDTWVPKTDCPAHAWYNTHIAVAGGHSWMMQYYNDSILDYDPMADSWTYKRPLPNISITAVYSDTNTFYVVNGNINVLKYDIANDSFITICPYPVWPSGNTIVLNQHGYDSYGNVYDFAADSWTVINTINNAQWAFAINDTGYGFFNGVFSAFDPVSNTIIPKASIQNAFPGFAIFGKGYVMVSDTLWQYDPQTDQWNQKMIFPGGSRYLPSLMAIGNYGYLYSGSDSTGTIVNDFWMYDPVSDSWTQKTAPAAPERYNCIAAGGNFSGYMGMGGDGPGNYFGDLWEYNPLIDSWTSISNPIGGLAGGYDFIFNDHLYLGGGSEYFHMGDYLAHYSFYKYTSIINSTNEMKFKNETDNHRVTLLPNPAKDHLKLNSKTEITSLEIYSSQGMLVYKADGKGSKELFINVENFEEGIYVIRCNGETAEKFIKE